MGKKINYRQDLGLSRELIHFDPFDNTVSESIWALKYKRGNERNIHDTIDRVVGGIYPKGLNTPEALEISQLMHAGVIIPGGRILAEAGTTNKATLMNCYVMGEIDDSIEGILESLHESAITSSQGGGVGLNFSTIRPKGAVIKGAESVSAGGPVAFMQMWDAMGHAFEAGGNRRGGKMAVLNVDHPDIVEFINAKRGQGVLTSFNISVAITHAFMNAVKNDELWNLKHSSPRKSDGADAEELSDGMYIWDTIRARTLWDLIMKSTYEFSEPGILFIDRINETNSLRYHETISATNPCGEQPLPPYGACNLGSVNLAMCVTHPFTYDGSKVNYSLIEKATHRLVDFLDTVIDTTQYPLEAQKNEALNKRRIGIGITGLADMLAQLCIPYGSADALKIAGDVMTLIRNSAYKRSAERADEYGMAPIWSTQPIEQSTSMIPFFKDLPGDTQNAIYEWGLRNTHLTSIAPTGTISAVFGDVSSGCEPVFAHQMERKVIVKDDNSNDTWKAYTSYSFIVRLHGHMNDLRPIESWNSLKGADFMQTATKVSPIDHVKMVAVLQGSVDSSISKTVNVPEDMPFDDFCEIYMDAYQTGCKGCTTYRPSEVRGAVLIDADAIKAQKTDQTEQTEQTDQTKQAKPAKWKRPDQLEGSTHKFDWPGYSSSIYVTINKYEGKPVEIFISSKNEAMNEWSAALSVVISSLLQTGKPAKEVAKQLSNIRLSSSPAFKHGKIYGSIIEMIGSLLYTQTEQDVLDEVIGTAASRLRSPDDAVTTILPVERAVTLSTPKCPECGSTEFTHVQGCKVCNACGHSTCG